MPYESHGDISRKFIGFRKLSVDYKVLRTHSLASKGLSLLYVFVSPMDTPNDRQTQLHTDFDFQ